MTAVISHDLDYGVLHPQHGYAVDDLDQVESRVAIDKLVGCSNPLFWISYGPEHFRMPSKS